MDGRYLEDQQLVEFQRVLTESLADGLNGDVEET